MTLKTYSNRKDILPVILFQNNTFYCIFDQKLFLQILPTPHFWTVVYLMLTYRALLYYIVIEMVKHIIYVQVTSHNLTLITFFFFFCSFRKIDVTQVTSTRSLPRWWLSWHQQINSSLWIWTRMNSKASPTPILSLSFRFNNKSKRIAPFRCESRRRFYYPESIILSLCILVVLSLFT